MAHYSILDLVPITLGSDAACALERSKQLAIKAESWGYHRYWVAEHHNMPGIASSATAVVIGHLARPIPRSIRLGYKVASVPNCSATIRGAWLGSMMPPDPTRMVLVADAKCPITTAVAELAMPGMLWCSATQYR